MLKLSFINYNQNQRENLGTVFVNKIWSPFNKNICIKKKWLSALQIFISKNLLIREDRAFEKKKPTVINTTIKTSLKTNQVTMLQTFLFHKGGKLEGEVSITAEKSDEMGFL